MHDFKFKKNDPMHIAILSENKSDVQEAWCEIVSSYSTCQLTRPKDKLPAISGLASRMYQAFPAPYLAGIWESALPQQLLWMVNPAQRYPPKGRLWYRAPSWSWASLDGAVGFVDPRGRMKSTVQILHTNTEVFNHPFGEVWSGYIKLKGYMFQVEYTETDAALDSLVHDCDYSIRFKTRDPDRDPTETLTMLPDVYTGDVPSSFHVFVRADRKAIGSRIFFLLFLSYTREPLSGLITFTPETNCGYMGLILRKDEGEDGVRGFYERSGFFAGAISEIDGDVPSLLAKHKPALDPSHYIEYDEASGQSTILLV